MDKQEQNLIALMDLAVNGRMQGVDQPDYPRLLTLARKVASSSRRPVHPSFWHVLLRLAWMK